MLGAVLERYTVVSADSLNSIFRGKVKGCGDDLLEMLAKRGVSGEADTRNVSRKQRPLLTFSCFMEGAVVLKLRI